MENNDKKVQKRDYVIQELKDKMVTEEQKSITCCFTGRRKILKEKELFVEQEIKKAVQKAIEKGYRIFLSGLAEGADTIAAQVVKDLQEQGENIILLLYLPYQKKLFKESAVKLIENCQEVWVATIYNTKGCYHLRNRYMVEHSSLLIAITDGKEGGGTEYTIEYAKKKEIDVIKLYF